MKGYPCPWGEGAICECTGKVQYGLRIQSGGIRHYLGKKSEMRVVNGSIRCIKENFEGVPEFVNAGEIDNEECWCFPSSKLYSFLIIFFSSL